MSRTLTRVNVLHSGGDVDIGFIRNLEEAVRENNASCNFEYTRFIQGHHQNIADIVYYDAKRYEGENEPVIVLISTHFLNVIWQSNQKGPVLEIITSLKHCIHIWLDVDEADIKARGNKLVLFRKIKASELTILRPVDQINTIRTLLADTVDKPNDSAACAVDNTEDDMREKFQKDVPTFSKSDPANVPKTKKKKKTTAYKEALKMASMDEDELEEYIAKNRNNFPQYTGR